MFDDVMLLGKGGRLVYLGPSRLALHYFESLGFALPPNENPAGGWVGAEDGFCAGVGGGHEASIHGTQHHSLDCTAPATASNCLTQAVFFLPLLTLPPSPRLCLPRRFCNGHHLRFGGAPGRLPLPALRPLPPLALPRPLLGAPAQQAALLQGCVRAAGAACLNQGTKAKGGCGGQSWCLPNTAAAMSSNNHTAIHPLLQRRSTQQSSSSSPSSSSSSSSSSSGAWTPSSCSCWRISLMPLTAMRMVGVCLPCPQVFECLMRVEAQPTASPHLCCPPLQTAGALDAAGLLRLLEGLGLEPTQRSVAALVQELAVPRTGGQVGQSQSRCVV